MDRRRALFVICYSWFGICEKGIVEWGEGIGTRNRGSREMLTGIIQR